MFMTEDGLLWVTTFLTYFSLLSFMIPISLFVTIEVCKACQAKVCSHVPHVFDTAGLWLGLGSFLTFWQLWFINHPRSLVCALSCVFPSFF